MKGLRIGKRRARTNEPASSPLELALRPALADGRWAVPDKFNFARDVVEVLAGDPKRQALTFIGDDGVIEPRTFLEIAEGAARWRAILAEKGVQPKERVLVLAGSSVHWVEIVLGIMKIGAVAVPCAPTISAGPLEARVTSLDATLVVAEHACEPAIEQMSFAPEVHYIDEGHRRRSSDVPKESPTHDTSSRDLAFVFTSPGATGAPKEVAHTHGAVFAARLQAEHWLDAGRGDVVWSTAEADSPLHGWLTLVGPWSRGAEVVVHRGGFDPRERLDQLYRLGATVLCQSPLEYRALADLPRLERFRPPRLRRLVSTGDFLEPEVREVFEERWDLTIHDGYGQAETGIFVADGRENTVPGAIGHALPGYDVAIVDDQGNELPRGIEGDLGLRGHPPTLFAGYWEAPDETKRAFRGDWYLTGDLALQDEEDRFVFVGRAEDVITSSGRTFGPYGVEHVLRGHAAIAAAAVVGIRDLQRGGHFVRAFVVPTRGVEGSEQLEAELRRHVADTLPEQQVPREIVFVEALPLVGGKVSRSTLRERPIMGRPLWDLPPTSEADVVAAPVRPAAPPEPQRAEAAPTVPAPKPAPEPQPSAVEEPPTPIEVVEPVAILAPDPVEAAPVEAEPVAAEPVEAEPVAAEPVAAEPVAVAPDRVETHPAVALPQPVEAEPVAVDPPPEPVAVVHTEPEATPAIEPTSVETERSAKAEPAPATTAGTEPAAPVSPGPADVVEPEPLPAQVVSEPVTVQPGSEPVAPTEPEPAAAESEPAVSTERARAATVKPAPVARPEPAEVAEPKREPVALVEPEPTPVATPEPEPQPVAEPERTVEPEHPKPAFTVVPAPEAEAEQEPADPAATPADAEAEQDVLPDFVVLPGSRPEPPPPPRPDPEPEPPIELEPLPDYIVDPNRPSPPKIEKPERQAAETTPAPFPGSLVRPVPPEPEPSGAEAAGIYFPPVTSFPVPRADDGDEDAPREPRKSPRRRPAAEAPKTKRRRSNEEPGDDAGDAAWMAGLSNRLSAYSLAEDGSEPEPGDDDSDEVSDNGSDGGARA